MGVAATVSSRAIRGSRGSFCASSGPKVGHSLAACNIERNRSLVVHDQPIAVELAEAEGAPDPHPARRRPVLQRAAEPAESVPECHIITHGDGQVANLIVHILEERERPRPVLQLRLYPYMLERRIDVEGHDVRCVQPPQTFEILGPDSFHDLVNLLPDLGVVFLALRGHRYPSLQIGVESWLLPRKTKQLPRMSGRRPRGGACGQGKGWVKTCPAATRCRAAAFSDSSSRSSCTEPRCSMLASLPRGPTQPGPPSPPTRSSRCEPTAPANSSAPP